jgi:hypothetical protein
MFLASDFKRTSQPHTHKYNSLSRKKHNKLNYLDLTIANNHNQLALDIYLKPTTTDLIIHSNSCHPYEYKKSAINYLINRMNTFPITNESKDQELQTIRIILKNNHHQQITHSKQKQLLCQQPIIDTKIKLGHLHIFRLRYENSP